MDRSPHPLKDFQDAAPTEDGSSIAFTINTHDGDSLDVSCPLDLLTELIQYLALAAGLASEIRTRGESVPFDERWIWAAPMQVTQMAVISGGTQDTGVLVMRNYDFDLSFQMTTSQLRGLLRDVDHIAEEMGAKGTKPH